MNLRIMKHSQVKLEKIHLESFIDMLMDVYSHGGRYVDMIAMHNAIQDTVTVIVRDDYIQQEAPVDNQLTDTFLNELI